MERLREIIEEKYYWRPEYRISLDWTEKALEEGCEVLEAVNYLTKKLFENASKSTVVTSVNF